MPRSTLPALSAPDRLALVEAIESLDPASQIVTVDLNEDSIRYSDDITLYESSFSTKDEEIVRAYLVAWLCIEAGYRPQDLALEKPYPYGSGAKHAELDIRIAHPDSPEAFALVEAKRPDEWGGKDDRRINSQLFAFAGTEPGVEVLSLATVRVSSDGTPEIASVTIDYSTYHYFKQWVSAGKQSSPAIPAFYGQAPAMPFVKGTEHDLDASLTTEDFRRLADQIHGEFFSEHPDTELFTTIVKLLLAKIRDEKTCMTDTEYQFQVLLDGSAPEDVETTFARIAALYADAFAAYIDKDGDDSLDPKTFSPSRVVSVVSRLQGISITGNANQRGDVIGAFFETILRAGFKQDKGMYFTHTNLVWFMLEALDIGAVAQAKWVSANHTEERMPYILDPSCGSGAFLLRAMDLVTESICENRSRLVRNAADEEEYLKKLPDTRPHQWASDCLFGLDPKFVMAITAQVNMVLHGDGSTHILKQDALASFDVLRHARFRAAPDSGRSLPRSRYHPDLNEAFDVIVTNPPFGVTLSAETKSQVSNTFTLGDTATSEALFLERYAQLLRPGGRLAVVVPESLLNAAEQKAARLLLFRFFHVKAIVSLPRNLFVETPTLVSLLFAQKKTPEELELWDSDFVRTKTGIDTTLRTLKRKLTGLTRKADATSQDVQTLFLADTDGILPPDAFVRKGGKAPVILRMHLPASVATTAEAVAYYRQLMQTSGFGDLIQQATLLRMADTHDYTWPAYAVSEVGYKLSKRGERDRRNELCRFVDAAGAEHPNVHTAGVEVRPDIRPDAPDRVLDFIRRDVKWA